MRGLGIGPQAPYLFIHTPTVKGPAMLLSRRQFLGSAASVALAVARPPSAVAAPPATLAAEGRTIEVNGRAAIVYGLRQPNGTHGLAAVAGSRFRAELVNRLDVATLVHWHGLTPPAAQDGVPHFSQRPLKPGGVYAYDFPLERPGTNWMHSHVGLQVQQLLAAPLIVRDPAEAGLDEQEVVVMLHDFSFRDPEEIFEELRSGAGRRMAGMSQEALDSMAGMDRSMDHGGGTAMAGMSMDMPMAMPMDLNDVAFDAFLANDRTLADPQVVTVEPGGRVRLRVINGAAATNFWLDLGSLEGSLIAVDGMPVTPIAGSRFELAVAQRLDLRVTLPSSGVHPVLARREGDVARTGILLATKGATVARLDERAGEAAPAVGLDLERRLAARQPLPARPADRTHLVELTGDMMGYRWGLNGGALDHERHLPVREGERVHLVLRNQTSMSHPMHLHGHHFQVVGLGAGPLAGAIRDTVLVPVGGSVTLAFDADNPGTWAFHCHNLYHQAAGMMTAVAYEA